MTGTFLYVNVGIRVNLWIEWQHEFALYTIKKLFCSDFPQILLVCLSWGCKLKGFSKKDDFGFGWKFKLENDFEFCILCTKNV